MKDIKEGDIVILTDAAWSEIIRKPYKITISKHGDLELIADLLDGSKKSLLADPRNCFLVEHEWYE